jgi:hypothetical protein
MVPAPACLAYARAFRARRLWRELVEAFLLGVIPTPRDGDGGIPLRRFGGFVRDDRQLDPWVEGVILGFDIVGNVSRYMIMFRKPSFV